MILVFGKTGQVASELVAFENTLSLGREDVDLSDPVSCRDAIVFHRPEAVINAAAYTSVDKAEENEKLVRLVNGEAPASMAHACAFLKIPFVHISTDYVFDGSGKRPWSPADKPDPQNTYGKSKLQGEKAIVASGCTHAILRTSWVVSEHGNNFLKTMLRLTDSNEHIKVVDDQVGGPTFARDIARTCVLIAEQLKQDPRKTGTYHYTGQPDVSWCEFANAIFERTENRKIAYPILSSDYPTQASRPLNCRLDCSTTEEVFRISRPSWRDGLENIFKRMDQKHVKA